MPPTSAPNRSYAAAHFALELSGVDKLGMFRSIEGGGIKADVMTYRAAGTYDRWRQLGKPKIEDLKLQVGMAMSEPFYKWIEEFFAGTQSRKAGAIIAADFYYKERARREFTDAIMKELTFPKLDAADKNTAYMTVALAVEQMKFMPPKGAALDQAMGSQVQKSWKACNFRFTLDAFGDIFRRVTKVDSFTVKQNVIEYHSGGRRSPSLTPSSIDIPQISFYLPEPDAQPLIEHFTKRGLDGEVPGRFGGHIETFDNEQVTKFTLAIHNCDILSIQPDKSDASTEEIKQVKVDLYVESMDFKYEADSDF
jgi:phage tail-like protein